METVIATLHNTYCSLSLSFRVFFFSTKFESQSFVSEDEVGSSVETGLVARDYLCVSGWPSVLDERLTDIYLLRHESMLTKRS